jgi:pentatricopeptide repeat protein
VEVFEASRKAGNPLDVVSCTTMIKGYCGDGDLTAALRLIDDMEAAEPQVLPNIRTANTYLRGCLIFGAVEPAVTMLERLLAWKVAPDTSTYEYVLALLSQGLQLERCQELLKQSANRNLISVMQHLSVARCAALLGQWEACGAALDKADTMLSKALT